MVQVLLVGSQHVAFLSSLASISPHYFGIVVLVKASIPQHVFNLWLGVSKSMLPVRYFHSSKASLCASQITWGS